MEKRRRGRKLLIATVGVAAVSYVACGTGTTTDSDAGKDVQEEYIVANIMPPPPDSGKDATADGSDAANDARGDGPDDARNDAKD